MRIAAGKQQHTEKGRSGEGWWRPRRRHTLVLAIVIACAAGVVPSAGAESTPARGLDTDPAALWNAFPLRVAPTNVFTPPRAQPPFAKLPTAIPPAIVRSDGSSRSPWIVAAVIVALLLGAAGVAVVVLRGPAGRWSRAMTAALSYGRTGAENGRASWSLPRPTAEQSYLLVVHGRLRSRIVERMGVPPFRGELIFDDELGRAGVGYVVETLGPSPLPNDRRTCATLRTLSR